MKLLDALNARLIFYWPLAHFLIASSFLIGYLNQNKIGKGENLTTILNNIHFGFLENILILYLFVASLSFFGKIFNVNRKIFLGFGIIFLGISILGFCGKFFPDYSITNYFNSFWYLGLGIWSLYEIEMYFRYHGKSIAT